MAQDTNRDLVVGLISIETADASNSLLPEPILVFLDSGVSHLWLPEEACQRFETAFNLTYDSALDLYLVNDTVHETLLAQNVTVAFTISNNLAISTESDLVTINLPYSSFDLQVTDDYPGNNRTVNYFPIRRAANSSQYTLGRTFFQDAYVIADYERSTFSVHKADFPTGDGTQNLQAILPIEAAGNTGLSMATIAGIVAGAVALVVVFLTIGIVVRRRRGRRRTWEQPVQPYSQDTKVESELQAEFVKSQLELHGETQTVPELGNTFKQTYHELAAEDMAKEMSSGIQPRYEVQG